MVVKEVKKKNRNSINCTCSTQIQVKSSSPNWCMEKKHRKLYEKRNDLSFVISSKKNEPQQKVHVQYLNGSNKVSLNVLFFVRVLFNFEFFLKGTLS